jgi:hypothetical protein
VTGCVLAGGARRVKVWLRELWLCGDWQARRAQLGFVMVWPVKVRCGRHGIARSYSVGLVVVWQAW